MSKFLGIKIDHPENSIAANANCIQIYGDECYFCARSLNLVIPLIIFFVFLSNMYTPKPSVI